MYSRMNCVGKNVLGPQTVDCVSFACCWNFQLDLGSTVFQKCPHRLNFFFLHCQFDDAFVELVEILYGTRSILVKFTGFSYSVAVNGMKDEDNLIIFDENYYVPHFEVMYNDKELCQKFRKQNIRFSDVSEVAEGVAGSRQ
jgi:hypothetical protein